MAKTAVADDDRDREIAALRAEVAVLRQEVTMLRAVKLGSDAPPEWQRVIYPQTDMRWTNTCAGAPAVMNVPIQPTAAWQPTGLVPTQGCAGGYAGHVFTVPVP